MIYFSIITVSFVLQKVKTEHESSKGTDKNQVNICKYYFLQ